MINNNYTVTSYNTRQSVLSWTSANSTTVTYIYLNGNKIIGNIAFSSTERVILIPASVYTAYVLEIHDFEMPEDAIGAITETSNKLPLLAWKSEPTAVKYNIYANGEKIDTILKVNAVDNYTKQIVTKDFYGKIATWHFFTITSIDENGNESVLKEFPHYIWDIPPLISNLVVAEGSGAGLYDFTITL